MDDKERIRVLEARVAELEAQLKGRRGQIETCPVCGTGAFRVTKVNLAGQKRTLTCDNPQCGHVERRRVDAPLRA